MRILTRHLPARVALASAPSHPARGGRSGAGADGLAPIPASERALAATVVLVLLLALFA